MIFTELYYYALIKPCEEGANRLKIVSGYATSAMAFRHLEEIKKKKLDFSVSLLVGMCPADGLSYSNHQGFQNILGSEYAGRFSCSYVFSKPPVHTKLYLWYRGREFYKAFTGSANYTQNAFSENMREALTEVSDPDVSAYYDRIERDSIYCNHADAENSVRIYNDKNYYRRHIHEDVPKSVSIFPEIDGLESVRVSLLSSRTGEVPNVAGLNWGHRDRRNRNEAYLQLPPNVYRSEFFPKKPLHFTVVTDDGKSFICCRAEKGEDGKTIHTPHNNKLLGEYFRYRLGLHDGAFVSKADIERYGRTDVTFYKFDDENFLMDFSPPDA
jgi:hypothetical protein